MAHETRQATYLTLRMPRQLRAELRRIADQEANSESAVARRLIARGLAQERPQDAPRPETAA